MPAHGGILGFDDRWQAEALPHAIERELPSGARIRAVSPPYLLATKLGAFKGRGRGDFLGRRDFADIVPAAYSTRRDSSMAWQGPCAPTPRARSASTTSSCLHCTTSPIKRSAHDLPRPREVVQAVAHARRTTGVGAVELISTSPRSA
jgi:hypothetical protein